MTIASLKVNEGNFSSPSRVDAQGNVAGEHREVCVLQGGRRHTHTHTHGKACVRVCVKEMRMLMRIISIGDPLRSPVLIGLCFVGPERTAAIEEHKLYYCVHVRHG